MGQLAITDIVNVTVEQSPQGLGNYNTSNVACFSAETFANSFGSAGYKIYTQASDVEVDFGSASQTYAAAVMAFSQSPNILTGDGYFVVIPFIVEQQTMTPSAAPASGAFVLNYGAEASASIAYNATAATIQSDLRALAGLSQIVVGGTIAGGLTFTFDGVYGPVALLTVSSNTVETSGSAAVTFAVAEAVAGETMNAAIIRASSLVQFFGIIASSVLPDADILAAAATIQTLNNMAVFGVFESSAYANTTGLAAELSSASLDKTRVVYYGGNGATGAIAFAAGYAGRAFSVDFAGSNTTITMQLKSIIGPDPDSSITETIYALCLANGADIYASIQGVAKTLTSGANGFFDSVYNREWFSGALSIAYFNVLATTNTKIAQTPEGIDALDTALRQVCNQAVTNGYIAPGTWTSPDTFGNQADFVANIAQVGYYIYFQPLSKQSAADRAARKAPPCQIAAKEAGAIHTGNVIVNLNP